MVCTGCLGIWQDFPQKESYQRNNQIFSKRLQQTQRTRIRILQKKQKNHDGGIQEVQQGASQQVVGSFASFNMVAGEMLWQKNWNNWMSYNVTPDEAD